MQVFLSGADVALPIQFAHNGEPFVPDEGSVRWQLRGHAGQVISPEVTLLGVIDTVAEITVPAADNTLAADARREKRTALVTGRRGGFPFTLRVQYLLTGFLNTTIGPDDVRIFTGLDSNTLPDAEIDVTAAFFDVADAVTYDTLDAALGSTDGARERSANRAILAQAVLNLMPSMAARISKAESDGTTSIERFPVDLLALEARANDMLTGALNTLAPVATAVERTLIAVTPRTDPLTGA